MVFQRGGDDPEFEVVGNGHEVAGSEKALGVEVTGAGGKSKGGKKGKKGRKGANVDDDEYEPFGGNIVDPLEPQKAVPSEELGGVSKKKSAKKGRKGAKVDDDEFDVSELVDAESIEPEKTVPNVESVGESKKKGAKKGRKGAKVDDDEFDVSELVDAESIEPEKTVPNVESLGESKKKGGKKSGRGFDIDDEEYDVAGNNGAKPAVFAKDEPDEELSATNKKKGGKKGKKGLKIDDDEYGVVKDAGDEPGEPESILVSKDSGGSTKKKGGQKVSFRADAFDMLADLDDGSAGANEIEDTVRESVSAHADDYGTDIPEEIVFTGKKKAKGKKATKAVQEEDLSNGNVVDDPAPVSSKDELPEETQPEEEAEEIVFSGKKKPKKGKKDVKKEEAAHDSEEVSEVSSAVTTQAPSEVSVPAQASPLEMGSADVSEAARNSKKKPKKGKKSGRTAQEEEDLDAILAELEGPAISQRAASTHAEEASAAESQTVAAPESQPVDAPDDVESVPSAPTTAELEEVVESAAAKKKKKKKEKEKEKKAAAVEKPMEDDTAEVSITTKLEAAAKGKGAEKKVPKHLKAMQEQLLKIKEAEEKRKREEEEKLKKEAEEQARLEELERQKEEAKRRRKEREKEKLQQKKKEGKLLTGKQKEEARRLALMREQMLAHAGLPQDGEGGPAEEAEVVPRAPRKPKYDNKKKRGSVGQQVADHSTDAAPTESMEVDDNVKEENVVEPVESMETEAPMEEEMVDEKIVEEKVPEPEEEEDEEDWDAKSFEDVALPAIKSAFAEDEVEDEKPVVVAPAGKSTKRVVAQAPQPSIANRETSPEKSPVTPKRSQQKVPDARKGAPPVAEESEEETETEEDTEDEEDDDAETKKKRLAREKREARKADALTKRSADDLRSPICCILGHVDTGKTKLLDCIRRTNVQEGEAGGITQQIGATYFPMENIRERTKELKSTEDMKVPGLLVIDTPGHESFTNLRARGSSLCDIAILVVDIMHGLEPQTIESLKLLQMRKTPFVVALNKVDRLYDWRSIQNGPIKNSLKLQGKHVVQEFESRTNSIISQFMEQGMNAELYYKNKDTRKVISIVPTSALSGEGIPDILMLLILLTQKLMEKKLMYVSEVQATVLEVKMIEGRGTTIDVVLVNGVLHEGDQIVVCGMQGPIVTNIRSLLTPHPMKELRVKGSYEKHKELKAAQGIKITAQGLEHAIAGTQLYVVGPDDDVDDIKEEAMQDMKNVMSRVDKSGEGVCVQASTLGSLEALLEFLKSPAVKIPVSGINIGPVHKKDVMRASVMLERTKKEFATILAFDVKVTQEAKELAEELGVRIFTADIIYHLFDQFTNYIGTVKEEKRKESADEAVFPCVLQILPECVFNKKDPIIVGVNVMEGTAKVGTPLCVPSREFIEIGRIASMEVNHKVVDTVKKGQAVAMKIIGTNAEETQKMVGRHFEHEDELVSSITRRSIDLLKENYRDDVSMDDWKLLVKLKVLFQIP